eukprot:gene13720-13842_t
MFPGAGSWLNDQRKIGLGLTAFGFLFTFLGVMLFFDRGLLAMGNLLFLAGLTITIGVQATVQFFSRKKNRKGSAFYLSGAALVVIGWTIIGLCIEAYGFWLLFCEFIPVVLQYSRRIPFLTKTNGQGIKAMLISKAKRHELAWNTYESSKDKAQKQHDQMVASAAAALNDKLTSLNASIDMEMAVLAEDVIMQLDEQQIMQVWDTATTSSGGSSLLVDELGVAFAAAEAALRQSIEGALLIMVSQMCEVGHLDEGQVQRLMENEDGQETASDGLGKLCQRICKLQPPVLTKNLTDVWVKDAQDWNSQWSQHLEDHLHKLQQHEEQMEQQAFLKRQAAEWKLALDILSHWLCSLVVVFEGHKNDLTNAELAIKGHLKNARDCFAVEDAGREAAMEAAVLSVSHGSSEAALDDAVERALQCLATIEAGYRKYAASAIEAAQGYSITISDSNERYSICLCGMLHRSLLAEMEESRARSQGSAEAWSQQVETVITQELDSRLRAHRPRAGRLEEEVRASRSSELVGQRRCVQQHMQSQSTAVKQQSSKFDESVQQLQADVASWKAKLLNCEKLLSNSLSLKRLDVTWRENLALKGKLDKQVLERVDTLHAWVSSSCAAVTAANRKFEDDKLKPFADGGSYADENITAYKASISGIDHHMEGQQQQQRQQLSGLLADLSAELQGAQQQVEDLLPSYEQDMTLIEALNRYVEGAKKTVSTQLGRNRQAAEEINATLAQLQHQLDLGTLAGPDSSIAVEAAEGSPGALQQCQGILSQLNCLRLQLLRQAQVLNVLQSSNLAQTSIGVIFSPQLPPLIVSSLATGTSAVTAVDLQGPPGPVRSAVPPKQPHQASGSSAGGSHPMAQAESSATSPSEFCAVALAKEVQSVVNAANQEVETAAKAYYAAKDPNRPVRYPARIPATHVELINQTGSTLADLAQQLQHHMTSAEQQLRVQIVQAYRLLQQAPATAMALTHQHLLAAAQQQYAALLADFGSRHKTLELQLEQHKRSLKPSMLHPHRRAELQALKQAEATRQADAAALTAACVAACLSLTSSHAHQLTRSLAELCQLLLQLLDGFVMPADLAAAPESGAAVEWQGLPRKSLMELSKLALALDEAAPIGEQARTCEDCVHDTGCLALLRELHRVIQLYICPCVTVLWLRAGSPDDVSHRGQKLY